MRHKGLAGATRFLVLALVALYVLAAATGALFVDFATTRDLVFWLVFLCGGALLMVLGLSIGAFSAWRSAVLVSVGAAVGGLPLFWTIVVPVAVAVVIASSVALARRAPSPA